MEVKTNKILHRWVVIVMMVAAGYLMFRYHQQQQAKRANEAGEEFRKAAKKNADEARRAGQRL